jgi:XTP/dITP diphosphohydrolase
LLANLEGAPSRRARFVTVIAASINGKEIVVEGDVWGEIALSLSGSGGFGYDPIFKPSGYENTFAELSLEVKNHGTRHVATQAASASTRHRVG